MCRLRSTAELVLLGGSSSLSLSTVSTAGAARDGVIIVIVGGGGGGGGAGIVVIIEVVRERSWSFVFGRLEVDRNLNRNSFLMMMT